jgi:O-antigen/teichoic acid export membrane protein
MGLISKWKEVIRMRPALSGEKICLAEKGADKVELLRAKSVRQGIVTLADQAVISATNFFAGVIIGRTLAKEDFGLYMLGFSIVLFIMSLQTSLILAPYYVYSPHLQGVEHRRYTGSAFIHQLCLSVIAMLCLVLGGFLASLGIGPQGFSQVIWPLAAITVFILLKDCLRQIFFAQLRMTAALLMDSGTAVIQLALLLLLAKKGLLSPGYVFWILGIACALPALGLFIKYRDSFKFSIFQARESFKQSWSFAKWSVGSAIASWMLGGLYPWFLAGFHNTATVGVYAACWGLMSLINPILMGTTNLLNPMAAHAFAQGGAKQMNRIVSQFTLLLLVVMSAFCLLTLFKGDWLLGILYGPKYAGNGQIVFWLSFGYMFSYITIPICCGLMAAEMPDLVFKSYLLGVVFTFVFGIPLVKYYAIAGVAMTMIINALTVSSFRYRCFRGYMAKNPIMKQIAYV